MPDRGQRRDILGSLLWSRDSHTSHIPLRERRISGAISRKVLLNWETEGG